MQLEGALPPPVDLLERFLTYFIQKYNLTAGSRWARDMDNVLQMEAIEFTPQVRDTLGELKKKITAKLRPPLPASVAAAASPIVLR